MKAAEKRTLWTLGGLSLLLFIAKKASADTPAKGRVVIGPVTVSPVEKWTQPDIDRSLALKLALDRADQFVRWDDDMGAQRRPTATALAEMRSTAIAFRDHLRKTNNETPDETRIERLVRESQRRPSDDSLVRATNLVRTLTGWSPETFEVTRKPTASEVDRIRAAIRLWQAYSQTAADTLQVLLDDALALPAS